MSLMISFILGKSIQSQRASFGLQSKQSGKSNKSMTPVRSQGSKKSLQNSINKIRTRGRKEEVSLLNPNQKKITNAFAQNLGRDTLGFELDNLNKMSTAINSKLKRMTINEAEDTFFKNGALNKLPPVQNPIISRIDSGRTTFVAGNDAHSKESNFGYSRNKLGGFYNH